RGQESGGIVHGLNETATIWFERNVLLDNERWPKRALIQPLRFPAGGEMKVGKGTPAVELHALAVEYAVADRDVADRWRALTLADLRTKDLGISGVPGNEDLPPDWTPRDKQLGLTVDEVKLRLEKIDNGAPVHPRDKAVVAKLRELLQGVDARASEQGMSRTLRKLIVPGQVTVKFRGKKQGQVTLERQADYEYKGKLEDLTESLTFDLRAEDFISDSRKITVVPPPLVVRLEQEESSP